jgi:hypothetical protein
VKGDAAAAAPERADVDPFHDPFEIRGDRRGPILVGWLRP